MMKRAPLAGLIHDATMPVLHQSKLVGILTAENLGEFLMIQTALRSGKPTHAATA